MKKFERKPNLKECPYYIDKDILDELVKEFYEKNSLTDELGIMILNLIEQVKASMWKFIKNKTTIEIETAEGKALEQIIKSLNKKTIDVEKGRAYNYMWSIVVTRFLNSFSKSHSMQRKFAQYIQKIFDTDKTIEEIVDDLNFSQFDKKDSNL